MKVLSPKALWVGILSLFLALAFLPRVQAEETVVIHFFYTTTCAHCHQEEILLTALEAEFPELVVHRYDLDDPQEYAFFQEVVLRLAEAPYGDSINRISGPLTVIGGYAFSGFEDVHEEDIRWLIERNSLGTHPDIVQKVIDGQIVTESDFETLDYPYVTLPIVGKVLKSEVSLGLAAVLIGFVDGFNPCAMWILILMITLLANQRDRKRMWILGSAFLLTSGLVYFLIMMSWLQIVLPVAGIPLIRILIGIVAMAFGAFNVGRFVKLSKTPDIGCDVTDASQRRKWIDRVKKILSENNLWIALGGIILLAVSVNILEVACSAGLPAIFTSLLAFRQMSAAASFAYVSLYVLFFLIDDLVVFAIAMITLRVTGITNKYTKYSHLVGGIIMAVLGFLLLFFPEIVMFSW